jgi:hypothetical protein
MGRSSYLVRHCLLSTQKKQSIVIRVFFVVPHIAGQRSAYLVRSSDFAPPRVSEDIQTPPLTTGSAQHFPLNKGLILTVSFLFSFPLPFSTHHNNSSMLRRYTRYKHSFFGLGR